MIKELRAGDPATVGQYRLLGRLGAGGMGVVYLAKSPGGRLVAIKLIRPELAEERGFRERFSAEIAAARHVSGIFTAAVVDADADAELPWMATVFVPGPSLTDAVEEHGPLPEQSVLALAAGLAEALEAIHRADLVHRDLKPSNVLLASDGPRVIDFGISRALERSMMTTTGMVLGSPGFMSPEQAMGQQVGKPSDVFSLGTILAYAATGGGPFGVGPTPALLYRVVNEPADLTNVPERIRPLIESCLAKDPADRPTPAELLAALSDEVEVLTGEWLPAAIADGMGKYVPAVSTPLPPSLRDPASQAAAAEAPEAAPAGPDADAPQPAAVTPAPSVPPGTELAAAPPRPAAPVAATVVERGPLADAGPVARPAAVTDAGRQSRPAAVTGNFAGPPPVMPPYAGPRYAGPPSRLRQWRWPAAALAAVVIIVVAVSLVLTRSSSAGPRGVTPGPAASLAGATGTAPSGGPPSALGRVAAPAGQQPVTGGGGYAPSGRYSPTPGHSSAAATRGRATPSTSPACTACQGKPTPATSSTPTPAGSSSAPIVSSPPPSTVSPPPSTVSPPPSTPDSPPPDTSSPTPTAS